MILKEEKREGKVDRLGRQKYLLYRLIKCDYCGKEEWYPYGPSGKNQPRKYCSYECHHKAMDKKIEKICPICGKTFRVKKYQKEALTCCSIKCRNIRLRTVSPKGTKKYKGRRVTSDGYIAINRWELTEKERNLFAPMINKDGYILEHRFIVAKYLGRNLTSREIVHHKNKIRNDNKLINLQLMDKDYHSNQAGEIKVDYEWEEFVYYV